MRPIDTLLFELFKTGPGPSSSHTIGPMQAACHFRELCRNIPSEADSQAGYIKVELLGSLSATCAGHGTKTAILAGLLGHKPETCPAGLIDRLNAEPDRCYSIDLGSSIAQCGLHAISQGPVAHSHPYSNTLIFSLCSAEGRKAFEKTYYSVGGGFIQWDGWTAPDRGMPVHPYTGMSSLRALIREKGLNICEIILDNEAAISGASRPQILSGINALIKRMQESVVRGLKASGLLPGPLGVQRKAGILLDRAMHIREPADQFLTRLNAYAFAAAEENAAGGIIVTAPTCGAAGVMPALVYAMRHDLGIGDRAVREGFLAAAAVGFIVKNNASISGAEVGCQGEIGVASAMGAAMLTDARGNRSRYTENAAEVALEHHLGITCDPVQGYVQIPCIERNAMGAVKAYNASLITTGTDPYSQRVSLDSAISAMAEIGKDMNVKFKETSLGGLAVSMVEC